MNIGAGLCLVAMVCVIAAGVVMRYFLGNPLMGANEIVQTIAVALVMLALPQATATGAHIRVDLLDRTLGRWGRLAGDILARVLSITVLGHLCLRAFAKATEAAEYGDATNMLQLPLWPVYGAILIGMGLCILVFAAQILGRLMGWTPDHE
nr:TRAP transporter small permease [Rhodobacter sp. NTK016B]